MKVAIEKTFPMPGSVDAVWALLEQIEGVAGCMPGAKITERLDDTHFKGTVAVKVGPASMAFKGDIEVKELDVAQHVLHLLGKGSDSSGTSGASMDLVARVEPGATPETSNLIGKSEVTMSGKAAAFGGRMMGSVADQILKQFAANFAKKVSAGSAAAAATAVAAPSDVSGLPTSLTEAATRVDTAGSATIGGANVIPLTPAQASPSIAAATPGMAYSAPSPVAAPVVAPVVGSASPDSMAGPISPLAAPASAAALGQAPDTALGAAAVSVTASGIAPTPAPALTAPRPAVSPQMAAMPATNDDEPANEINALALFWAIFRDWLRGLFRRKPA